MASDDLYFPSYESNTVRITVRLKKYGQTAGWDVSAATAINLEWTNPATGTDGTPITVNSGETGADWASGIVVALISGSDITAAVGSYPFALTVTISGETITAASGIIEVKNRPGFTPP